MPGTVVVCGVGSEEPVSMLLDSLEESGVRHLFLDQRRFDDGVEVRWRMTVRGVGGSIRAGSEIVSVKDISGVFMRMLPAEMIDEVAEDPRRAERTRSLSNSLVQLFDLLPCRVVNRRRPMMSNNSKPYQSMLIREAGFSIPETLITSDHGSLLRDSISRNPIIFKSMSSVRSIVKEADLSDLSRLRNLRNLPTQFQEKIQGYCARVHVVGEKAIATRIHSGATDYRYAALENSGSILSEMPLNCQLEERCVSLARHLGLNLCGIDLMIASDRIVCLEVNPCPGYSYYQKATGQRISAAIADFLSGSEAEGSSRAG